MQRETIARYLEEGYKGRKNAISSHALEKALGLSGNELRKKINRLRCDSIPISACRGGYFYAETAAEAEVYDTIRSLEKMRDGLNAAIAGLVRLLDGFGKELDSG